MSACGFYPSPLKESYHHRRQEGRPRFGLDVMVKKLGFIHNVLLDAARPIRVGPDSIHNARALGPLA